MKPIRFKGCNATYAEHQPQYVPLPCVKDSEGLVTTVWEGTVIERIKFLISGKVKLFVMTFNQPLQPLKMEIK